MSESENSGSYSDDEDRETFGSDSNDRIWSIFRNEIRPIKHNDSRKDLLRLSDCTYFTPKMWERLGTFLGRNNYVRILCLQRCGLSGDKLESLCQGLQHNRSVEHLELNCNSIGANEMKNLAPFLCNNSRLRKLYISRCLTPESFPLLSRILRQTTLDTLGLSRNDIDDNKINDIIKSMDLSQLQFLHLKDNKIGDEGCCKLAEVFRDEKSLLRTIYLNKNQISDDGAVLLAESLKRNKKLENLILSANDGITKVGVAAFLRLVCDSSSINNTYNSNHVLKYIWLGVLPDATSDESVLLEEMLKVNERGYDLKAIGRHKVEKNHFSSEFSLLPLVNIDVALMPYILEFIALECNLDVFHRILRHWNMPVLYSLRAD